MIKAKAKTNHRKIQSEVEVGGNVREIAAELSYVVCCVALRMEEEGVLADGVAADDWIDCVAGVAREMFKTEGKRKEKEKRDD